MIKRKQLKPEYVPYKQDKLKPTDVLGTINGQPLTYGGNVQIPSDVSQVIDSGTEKVKPNLVDYKQDKLNSQTSLGKINGEDFYFGGDIVVGGSGGSGDLVKITGYNLFNAATASENTGISSSTGQTSAVQNYCTSDYIEVTPNTKYSFKARYNVCWFDSEKTFLSGSPYSEWEIKTLTSPINARYVRFSFDSRSWLISGMCMNKGEVPLNYSPYESYLSVNPLYLSDYSAKKFGLEISTIKLQAEGIADPTNLCLIATRCIWSEGQTPNYTGFLYLDIVTQKLYYSNNVPDKPEYLCDWDISLTENHSTKCEYYDAIITADGDIVFLRDHARQNPIIYPHTDYTHPYVVDFGDDKKPYGYLMNSSVVCFDDGSFCFGDYAYHSLQDEQNDDRRIIWKVSKPYAKANWVQAHSFKHVYFQSPISDEPNNEIGHIHAVNYDWYNNILYCTTGDIDRHCRLWYSLNKGNTWQAVPGIPTVTTGNEQGIGQLWRFTNMIFTKDYVYWATDSFHANHVLYRLTRDANNVVDASSITALAYLDGHIAKEYAQPTYASAYIREPHGILLVNRAEPRSDGKLDVQFYSFDDNRAYVIKTLDRATTDASELDTDTRIGLPNQTTMMYESETGNYIMCGAGTYVRPHNTNLFRNSLDNYVGALKLKVIKL